MYEIEKYLIFRLLVLFLSLWLAAFVIYTLIFGFRDPITNALSSPASTAHVTYVTGTTNKLHFSIVANDHTLSVPLPDTSWSYAGERVLTFPGSDGQVVQAIFTRGATSTSALGKLSETLVVELFPSGIRASDIATKPNLYAQAFFDRCLSSGTIELPSAGTSRLFESRATTCQDPVTGGPFSLYALQKRISGTSVVRLWYYATEENELLTRDYRSRARATLDAISVN